MHWDVKTVKLLPEYRLYVEIEDGRRGIFDMSPYLERGVFRELKDERYFRRVGILYGAVTWPNEQDIAPETLLADPHAPEVMKDACRGALKEKGLM